jgi:hypothetical protein
MHLDPVKLLEQLHIIQVFAVGTMLLAHVSYIIVSVNALLIIYFNHGEFVFVCQSTILAGNHTKENSAEDTTFLVGTLTSAIP